MLKSNAKKVRDALKKYIIECSRDEILEHNNWVTEHPEDGKQYDPDDFESVATAILEDFVIRTKRTGGYPRNITVQDLFREWAQGLTWDIFDYYYIHVDSIDILGDMLDQTFEERHRFTNEQADKKLTDLIFRELSTIPTYYSIINKLF